MTTYERITKDAKEPTIKKAILEEITPFVGESSGGIHQKMIERNVAMRLGKKILNRTLRKSIEVLRNEGHLICSNNDDGYWMASNMAEVEGFIHHQYIARINTINGTIKKVRKNAMDKFTNASQPELIP